MAPKITTLRPLSAYMPRGRLATGIPTWDSLQRFQEGLQLFDQKLMVINKNFWKSKIEIKAQYAFGNSKSMFF
jgi:hypothetical protein